MSYSWVCWDVHGVTEIPTFGKTMEVLRGFRPISDETAAEYRKLGDDYAKGAATPEVFWSRVAHDFGPYAMERARKYFLRIDPNRALWRAMPDLKKKYFMGIVSDSPGEKTVMIKNFLEERNPRTLDKNANLFDDVFFSSDYGVTKTDGGLYKVVLEKYGGDPSRFLVVDDSKANIEEAANLGMGTHLYRDVDSLLDALMPNRLTKKGIVG